MSEIETRTMAKVSWRLVPFLMLCYFIAYLDRVNLGFAGGPMSKDLGFSASVFGGAAGIFFIAYFVFGVPSNFFLQKFGARLWIGALMIAWGVASIGMAFITGPVIVSHAQARTSSISARATAPPGVSTSRKAFMRRETCRTASSWVSPGSSTRVTGSPGSRRKMSASQRAESAYT